MQKHYDHLQIEQKWRTEWEKARMFQETYKNDYVKDNKVYNLFAFAYPSGTGLHVGHLEPYVALDILTRFQRMNRKSAFFPVGWDSFGLPAENYAVKTGVHPKLATDKAIVHFSEQLKKNAVSKDWDTELLTSNPDYYKWTQWLFLLLYKAGKAYKREAPVNWCPSCKTVLANEQVVDGKCERCGTEVIQKNMNQWFFKITDYVEELISGLKDIDWPESTKQMQINWIGKSVGAEIRFPVEGIDRIIDVFTTRPDTVCGATYLVVSPENPILKEITKSDFTSQIEDYVKKAAKKTERERTALLKDKTGVFTGSYAKNPFTGEKIPIWVGDYVISSYGTGALMGVPAHDERDHEFAITYDLPIKEVVTHSDDTDPYTGYGLLKNSGKFDGLDYDAFLEESSKRYPQNIARKVNYKLRDWLISRQRYWGAPIPMVYDPEGNPYPIEEAHLPWLLPEDVDFKPFGESPLKDSVELKERVERIYGKGWTPEYDTMDTFVDSSWYFIRYADPHNVDEFASRKQIEKLLPVDFYLIGAEHTVLHLLYSRFFTKFLRDQGYLAFDEPFMKMRHQGMILGSDNKKMSKSKGNAVNPDEIVNTLGSDTLRVYEMFLGPLEVNKPWDTNGVKGVRRFLNRVWALVNDDLKSSGNEDEIGLKSNLNELSKFVGKELTELKFNTAIARMMEFINEWEEDGKTLRIESSIDFLKILAPFAPFISEELYQELINKKLSRNSSKVDQAYKSIHVEFWPEYDESLSLSGNVSIVVQVNGKFKGVLENLSKGKTKEEIIDLVKGNIKIFDGNYNTLVYVQDKLINFVK